MRIVSSHSLLHGRRHLKRGLFALAGAACLFSGCAKFPSTPDNSSFTKVIFRIRVDGTINSQYFYDVAIRASTDPNPDTDPQRVPQPVVGTGSQNGRMGGSPTHFVEYAPTYPLNTMPFVLYRFSLQSEIPNPSDPNNPVNLGSFLPNVRGPLIDYDQVVSGETKELRFAVYINQLGDTDQAGQALQALQVQFLTMSRLADGTGTRYYDYLGPLNQPQFLRIDLRSNNTYSSSSNSGGIDEQAGDCPIPDLDIVSWSVEVQKP